MTVTERAEIVINILQIYEKVQIAGGTPVVKREMLDIFKDIILCRNKEELEEVTINFINRGVEN